MTTKVKKPRAKKEPNLKSFIIAGLRRASYRWPERTKAKNAARISRGLYECNGCKNAFGPKDIKLDHIDPVVDVKTGFTNWDDYINRMFCKADGFQVLCDQCHTLKTAVEKQLRVLYKDSVKK